MMQRWAGVRSHPSGQFGFAEIRIKTGYSGHFEGFLRIFSKTLKPDETMAGITRIIEVRNPDLQSRGIPDLLHLFITTAAIGPKRVFFFMLINLIFNVLFSFLRLSTIVFFDFVIHALLIFIGPYVRRRSR